MDAVNANAIIDAISGSLCVWYPNGLLFYIIATPLLLFVSHSEQQSIMRGRLMIKESNYYFGGPSGIVGGMLKGV